MSNARMENLVNNYEKELELAGTYYVCTDPDCYGQDGGFDYSEIVDEMAEWLQSYGIDIERVDDPHYIGFFYAELSDEDRVFLNEEIWEAFCDETEIWESCCCSV